MESEYNVHIVIIFLDTLRTLGTADNKKELERYKEYYKIDLMYSIDYKDCKDYRLIHFDIYSDIENENRMMKKDRVLYVGNARNKRRKDTVVSLYMKIKII